MKLYSVTFPGSGQNFLKHLAITKWCLLDYKTRAHLLPMTSSIPNFCSRIITPSTEQKVRRTKARRRKTSHILYRQLKGDVSFMCLSPEECTGRYREITHLVLAGNQSEHSTEPKFHQATWPYWGYFISCWGGRTSTLTSIKPVNSSLLMMRFWW